MKNNAESLKNILFETLESLHDREGKNNLDEEIKRAKAITDVSQTLINLAKEEISFQKLKFNYGDKIKGGQFFEVKQIGN